jgi:hypothetical protein
MLRDPKVIEHLNTQLTNELTAAINTSCTRRPWSTGV